MVQVNEKTPEAPGPLSNIASHACWHPWQQQQFSVGTPQRWMLAVGRIQSGSLHNRHSSIYCIHGADGCKWLTAQNNVGLAFSDLLHSMLVWLYV